MVPIAISERFGHMPIAAHLTRILGACSEGPPANVSILFVARGALHFFDARTGGRRGGRLVGRSCLENLPA